MAIHVYNPEVISKIMGVKWLLGSKFINSGVLAIDGMPVEGLSQIALLDKRFQDVAGQAVAAGGTITLASRSQAGCISPRIFRYGGIEEPNVDQLVEKKGVDVVNASMAEGISEATAQYIDTSSVKALEGIAAMLTDNQYDAGASLGTLADIVDTMAKLGEHSDDLLDGAIVMRSLKKFVFYKLGIVALTSNTMGIAAQDKMVADGKLPTNIIGLTPIVTDKLALEGGGDYYTYIVGRGAMTYGYNGAPDIDTQRKYASHKTIATTFQVNFTIGAYGVSYKGTIAENITDANLATNANWEMKESDNEKIAIVRLQNAPA